MIMLIMLLLTTKHLIADFLIQPKWMWANKDKFNKIGGYAHAGFHALLTGIILAMCLGRFFYIIVLLEFIIHFFIDSTKMRLNSRLHCKCDGSPEFWYLLGVDQYLHMLTYLGIVEVLIYTKIVT